MKFYTYTDIATTSLNLSENCRIMITYNYRTVAESKYIGNLWTGYRWLTSVSLYPTHLLCKPYTQSPFQNTHECHTMSDGPEVNLDNCGKK